MNLVTGCVLCRASCGQLDTSEALFFLMGISAENSCNKVTVVKSIWKFFFLICVCISMSETANNIVISIMVVVELFQTLIRRGRKTQALEKTS